MKKILFVLIVFLFSLNVVFADAPTISIFPEGATQGEPVRITVENVSSVASIKRVLFDGTPIGVFVYQGKVTALIGIDLNKKPGNYVVSVVLTDGTMIEKSIVVNAREKIEAPLGIPEKLGGNTVASQTKLVSTLAQENVILSSLWTQPKALWKEKFLLPVANPVVTDSYGYLRQTGSYSIAHKGTDFRASEGTKVFASNRGVVRLVKTFRNYGKTIVVDHGLGLVTFYMHLSKINVAEGQLVLPGQLIGLSGQTGYAEKPHLHFTLRVGGISIDAMKFMQLFQ